MVDVTAYGGGTGTADPAIGGRAFSQALSAANITVTGDAWQRPPARPNSPPSRSAPLT